MNKLKDAQTDQLMQALLQLKTVDECYAFFEDLCTIREIKSMAQRFEVAQMLVNGRVYSDIVADTGASTATISRVNRSLEYGADGYRMVFERMGK
ncbi:MAG: YerC/YecD family TrpR-related protein [Firmicutes bacterium]|nr:YerC/YecD family TrpR-related protein [Bacillota bacterium]